MPGHTGLLYCMAQTSNDAIVLMVKPDVILLLEVKVQPAKAKVSSMMKVKVFILNIFHFGFLCLSEKIKLTERGPAEVTVDMFTD